MSNLNLNTALNSTPSRELVDELVLEIYRLRAEVDRGCPHIRPVGDRFTDLYQMDNKGCWIWQGTKNNGGYGKFNIDGVKVLAHRWSYEFLVGEIPEGLVIDHLCRVRSCVNPEHLEPVTQKENYLRGEGPTALNARKTHCKSGHEFTEDNTTLVKGKRHCKTCNRRRTKEYYQRRKEVDNG